MARKAIGITERLLSLPIMAGIASEDVARLAAGTTEVRASRGTVLYREGSECTGLYFVVTGQVKLSFRTDRGQEKVLRLVGEGMSLGEPTLFLGKCHLTTAEAIADTKFLHVAKDVVLAEVAQNAAFASRIITELCQQLHDRTLDLQSYLLLSARQRVISYLLSQLPTGVNGMPVAIMLPAKKGIIASRLHLTQEHFSRILHELAVAKLIEVEGRTVRIPDAYRLTSQRNT
jgi:CRP/FNR family transcriptional regulator, dissimilatory nitrate respiration regulator